MKEENNNMKERENDDLSVEKLDFSEMEELEGGKTGCTITNGKCNGDGAGCVLTNGKCNLTGTTTTTTPTTNTNPPAQ